MNQKITLFVILTIALVLSIVLGTAVGEADYEELSIYGAILLVLCYFVFAYRFTWQLILLVSYLGFNYMHGFSLEAKHIAIALLGLYSLISLFKGKRADKPMMLRRCGSRFLVGICSIWLLYGFLHFFTNMAIPYEVNSFGMGNSLKAYFVAFAPAGLIIWMLVGPINFEIGENWGKTILVIFMVALVINVACSVYLVANGFGGAISQTSTAAAATDEPVGFYIPGINAVPNPFILRSFSGVAVLFAFTALSFREWKNKQSKFFIFALWGMLGLALMGALISGGRAAILVSGFYVFVVCLNRRRLGMIAVATAGGIGVVIIANAFSEWVNYDAPLFVSRPLQYVMVEKGAAMQSIENSSDHRGSLYQAAIDEWLNDSRVLFFGRSIYRYTGDYEEMKIMLGDEEAFVVTNLRAGNCHALLPSALVQYGGIGTIIYYVMYLSMIIFFWRIYVSSKHMDSTIRVVSFVNAVLATVGILIATIGGGWFSVTPALMIGLLRSAIYREENRMQQQSLPEGQTVISN